MGADKMKRVRIPKAFKRKLEKEAKKLGMDTDEFATAVISLYLLEQEEK
ncbi:MAG: hypothetical protein QXI42_02285 [Thermoproteota archaeon]